MSSLKYRQHCVFCLLERRARHQLALHVADLKTMIVTLESEILILSIELNELRAEIGLGSKVVEERAEEAQEEGALL
jgi:hypothetical protein